MHALVSPGREPHDLDRLGAHVWAMSEGNPFVVVEALLAAAGRETPESASLPVPDRVRAAISRRLEHLGALGRELTAVAAVIGQAFTFTLLRHAAGAGELEVAEAVEELVRRQVLQHVGDHFDFVHERVREVVYGKLLPPRRALLHRAVAEAIEMLHAESPATQSLAVGLHYLRGEAWDKAVEYLGQAGSEAIARSAYREAAESLEQAIAALEHLPVDASRLARSIDLRLDLARPTLYQLGHVKRAAAVLREAEARARALGDDRRLGRVTAQLVFCLRVMGHKSEAVLAGERALDIAWRLSDVEIEIPANTSLGQVLHDQGDYRRAAALFRRNIDVLVGELSHRSFRGSAPRSIHSRTCLVSSLAELGEFDEAARYAEEAFRAAHALEHPHSLVVASAGLGHVLLRRGDGRRAIEIVEPALTIARAPEAALWFPRIASTLGAAYILADRPGDAYVLLEEALARTIARELVHQRALITVWLGEAAMALGRVRRGPPDGRAGPPAVARQRRVGTRGLEPVPVRRDRVRVGAWRSGVGDAPLRRGSGPGRRAEHEASGGAQPARSGHAERRARSLRPEPGAARRRDRHVPRDGHAVLDGESAGGAGPRLDHVISNEGKGVPSGPSRHLLASGLGIGSATLVSTLRSRWWNASVLPRIMRTVSSS